MVEYITGECIIDEYLNNWFTYDELADYLCIDVGRVKAILQSKDLNEKMQEKIQRHEEHITSYYRTIGVEENIGAYDGDIRFEIILDMLENGLSIREAARQHGVSRSGLHDYIQKKLPDISIKLYKQVFDLLVEHKSFSTTSKKVIEQVLKSYELLLEGKNISQIANEQGVGENVVQRNLNARLERIDKNKYEKAKQILADIRSSVINSAQDPRLQRTIQQLHIEGVTIPRVTKQDFTSAPPISKEAQQNPPTTTDLQAEKFKRILEQMALEIIDKQLTYEQAAEIFDLSSSTIYNLTHSNLISPFIIANLDKVAEANKAQNEGTIKGNGTRK